MRSAITPRLTLVLAIGCGVSVGNLYYAQPLLGSISHDLRVGSGAAGLVVTLSQVGYAVGLLLLVPLGDLVERRRLVVRVLLLTCVSLLAAGLAPSLLALSLAITAVGVTTVVPQILVPLAAQLAPEAERGRVVGRVMSGLLVGILLARTVAGLLAETGTWRVAFLVAAGLMLVLAVLLERELPESPPTSELGYLALLRSLATIAREEPLVRWRSLFGSVVFACFSVLWTSIAFLLSGGPYHYSPGVIGLFGLLGAAGAVMANLAGRLADAGRTTPATGALFVVLCGSFGLLALGRRDVLALMAGIVVLDLAVQGVHILNQSTIYTRRPESRSRITTIYMVSYFAGGAIGSASSAAIYSSQGWSGVCVLGAAIAAIGVLAWIVQGALARRGEVLSHA